MTTEELNKIDKCRHLLPEPAPEIVRKLVDQLRGYDKHLRVCMGWTMRASEHGRDLVLGYIDDQGDLCWAGSGDYVGWSWEVVSRWSHIPK